MRVLRKKRMRQENDGGTGERKGMNSKARGEVVRIQQKNILHQAVNRAHQPPRHCPVLSGPPSLITPVPKRTSNGSSVCSTPSSISCFRLDRGGTGNLGRDFSEINEGKSFSNEEYSGFVKSGAVQMRVWASISGDASRRDGLKFRKLAGALLTETSSDVTG